MIVVNAMLSFLTSSSLLAVISRFTGFLGSDRGGPNSGESDSILAAIHSDIFVLHGGQPGLWAVRGHGYYRQVWLEVAVENASLKFFR